MSRSGTAAAGEPAVAVEELIANLRLLPLLAGRIEISDITLVKPRIAVEIGPDGHTNWSPLVDTLARALQPNADHTDRVLSFSEIRINDGVIAIRDPARELSRNPGGRRAFARLAFDRQELRRHRPFRLARRNRRSEPRHGGFSEGARRPHVGSQVSPQRRSAQGRVRRHHELRAEPQGRRHARRRRRVAARGAALDRRHHPAGGRAGAVRAQGHCRGQWRNDCAVQPERRIRRQRRRGRGHLYDHRTPAAAGHARGREARSHPLCFDDPPGCGKHQGLGPQPHRRSTGSTGGTPICACPRPACASPMPSLAVPPLPRPCGPAGWWSRWANPNPSVA